MKRINFFCTSLLCAFVFPLCAAAAEPTPVDVLVVGGGTGGVTAALAASVNGAQTVLLEETPWIGGQFTSQGLPAPDEHRKIEFMASRTYATYRMLVRNQFLSAYKRSEISNNPQNVFDPGCSWVSPLTHTPQAALKAYEQLLQPALDAGRLTIKTRTKVTGLTKTSDGKRVATVSAVTTDEAGTTVSEEVYAPKYIVEATLLGDFLEMAGVPFSVGIESKEQTGEPAAYDGEPDPTGVQSFTFCFIVEFCEGENHTIEKPALYDKFKDDYSILHYPFRHEIGNVAPFWQYRRLLSKNTFDDDRIKSELAVINWSSNDYANRDLISASPTEREEIRYEAKQKSLGFLYWLQTECPRDANDGGGKGYPELKLRTDLLGTSDGLAMEPYIRESRRIKALTTLTQNDLTSQPTYRARLFDDAVATGLYYILDIHKCVGDDKRGTPSEESRGSLKTHPFQIPLGALIPQGGSNVLAGQKNLGVTHVANGTTRLHPVEWEIGEAAGTVAAMAARLNKTPEEIRADRKLLRELQHTLISQGVPIFWYEDIRWDDPAFQGAQRLAIDHGWVANPKNGLLKPGAGLTPKELEFFRQLLGLSDLTTTASRRDAAVRYMMSVLPKRPTYW